MSSSANLPSIVEQLLTPPHHSARDTMTGMAHAMAVSATDTIVHLKPKLGDFELIGEYLDAQQNKLITLRQIDDQGGRVFHIAKATFLLLFEPITSTGA